MPNIIPVPVNVSIGVPTGDDGKGKPRYFSAFRLVPYASMRNGGLEIAGWMYINAEGEVDPLDQVSLFAVMPRKLLWHVCRNTFEADQESIPIAITIDDQTWFHLMRAREMEYEQVHYEIEIEGEWMLITEAMIGDIVGEEQYVYCDREVLPSIDFGHADSVYDEMN